MTIEHLQRRRCRWPSSVLHGRITDAMTSRAERQRRGRDPLIIRPTTVELEPAQCRGDCLPECQGFPDGSASFVRYTLPGASKLASTMVDFDPQFEVMPGTHEKPPVVYRGSLPSRAGSDHRGVGSRSLYADRC
jgi:hypothetical protein